MTDANEISPTANMRLVEAARAGSLSCASEAFDSGADVDAGQTYSRSSLKLDHVVRLLTGKDASLETKWRRSFKCLEVTFGQLTMDTASVANGGKETPLMAAVGAGHYEMTVFLLEKGAGVDAQVQGTTALQLAACAGSVGMVQLLLGYGASVDLADKKGWTPLMLAARDGHTAIVKLLLEKKPSLDMKTKGPGDDKGATALLLAASRGHLMVVHLLVASGASINMSDAFHATPVAHAAANGHVDIVRLLAKKGADLRRGFAGMFGAMTPLKQAEKNGHTAVVAVLKEYIADRSCASSSSSTRSQQPRDSSECSMSLHELHAYSAVQRRSSQHLYPAMGAMSELCAGIYGRLDALEIELESVSDATRACFVDQVNHIVSDFEEFLRQYANEKTDAERLMSPSSVVVLLLRTFHTRIDTVIRQITLDLAVGSALGWDEGDWNTKAVEVEKCLVKDQRASREAVGGEVEENSCSDAHARKLLECEVQRHIDSYSSWMHKVVGKWLKKVTRVPSIEVGMADKWLFIPEHGSRRQETHFAEGSFGKVYRGKWLKLPIVVKCVKVSCKAEMQAFQREVEIWSAVLHDNIVTLYGACHKGERGYFVCEDASNGTLGEYLRKERVSGCWSSVWRKLHQAALGLSFLHEKGIIHGDLKCNNILVSKSNVAMIADFGLSTMTTGARPEKGRLGAVPWKAPECLRFKGERSPPSFKSDVYSLGMCVVEAVTGEVPWKTLPHVSIRWHLVRKKEFLKRPKAFKNDGHWKLVKDMCTLDPVTRLELSEVLGRLKSFALEEVQQEWGHRADVEQQLRRFTEAQASGARRSSPCLQTWSSSVL